MGCIDRITTGCTEHIYSLTTRENREESRQELDSNILECEGRAISEMQRIEIFFDMSHRSDISMVPLAAICGIDDGAEIFLGHSEVPCTEYDSGKISIAHMSEALDIWRRKVRKHGRTPETSRMWLTRAYGVLQ